MKNNLLAKKLLTATVIAIMVSSVFAFATPVAAAPPSVSYEKGTIVFDISHGQYSGSVAHFDEQLDSNLTAMGYEVVWAKGGLNDTILADAVALIIGAVYNSGFTTDEVTAVQDWYETENKFLWVGGDSDYGGNTYITDNMTLILEAVGSHVYHEPTAVEDVDSCCGSGYRAVANGTTDDPALAGLVVGVDAVLMHGPTLLYGSDSDTPAADVSPVDLETNDIDGVHPLLYYGAGAVIADGDITPPIAHDDGDTGAFVAMTIEFGNPGVIVVSGASPNGDYRPMFTDEYYNVTLNGASLVINAIHMGIIKATGFDRSGVIAFDYTHGQHSGSVEHYDIKLGTTLEFMGYTVEWILGGFNATYLAGIDGLIIGAVYNEEFTAAEVTAVADWFNDGHKFMWVGGDSDYGGNTYINGNMTLILEAVSSHVYHEPTAVEDSDSCCGSGYRAVANGTDVATFVEPIVENVDAVLMHGPTLLYGSNSTTPAADDNPVALETFTIEDVYPILYYGAGAVIADGDITPPIAHDDGDVGAFVAVTLETNAGENESSAMVVSGASPYGDYRPMFVEAYYGVALTGINFVVQAIDFGMVHGTYIEPVDTTTTTDTGTDTDVEPLFDTMTLLIIIGAVVGLIIIIIIIKKR